MSVDALVPEVRGALAVSSSFDDEKIPALIRRSVNRLLRDYHFPKAVQRIPFSPLADGDQQFTLPAGFKKELEIRLNDPSDNSWSDPLKKVQGFALPYPGPVHPRSYWIEGTQLWIDTPIDSARAGFGLIMWAETMDAVNNEDWLTEDYADAVFYFSVVRGCAEFRKPEVMQTYGPLWQDEQASLAIYLNELEWQNSEINMREAQRTGHLRYPKTGGCW
jgi:hypothetical protein